MKREGKLAAQNIRIKKLTPHCACSRSLPGPEGPGDEGHKGVPLRDGRGPPQLHRTPLRGRQEELLLHPAPPPEDEGGARTGAGHSIRHHPARLGRKEGRALSGGGVGGGIVLKSPYFYVSFSLKAN